MVEAYVDIAPLYSFKPIELEPAVVPIDRLFEIDPDSSSDSLDIGRGILSPIDIFRDSSMDGDSVVDEDMGGLPYVRRANPIDEQPSATVDDESELDDDDDDGAYVNGEMDTRGEPYYRVISPYPFSHTSKEEIEDREQLTSVLEWSLEVRPKCHVDYSSFFELGETANTNNDQIMSDDCDDFSLSSHEANSLSEDNFLGSISEDPASFWEDGVGPVMSDRSQSPTQVSLGSEEQ
jgi:hypothetical protein